VGALRSAATRDSDKLVTLAFVLHSADDGRASSPSCDICAARLRAEYTCTAQDGWPCAHGAATGA
jgi:hypothetical protein